MSLFGKAVNYNAEGNTRSAQNDDRVQDFLTGHGWALSGAADLVSGVAGSVLYFQAPDCIGIVRVGLLPPNGELTRLFAEAAGPDARVFYAYRGQIFDDPPRFAYLHAKVAKLMGALGFRLQANSSVIAVSQPHRCRLEAAVPWSKA
jgi:hypothetical protein